VTDVQLAMNAQSVHFLFRLRERSIATYGKTTKECQTGLRKFAIQTIIEYENVVNFKNKIFKETYLVWIQYHTWILKRTFLIFIQELQILFID